MSPLLMRRLLRVSCALTLLGLAMCLWSLLTPTPIAVVMALSVAQGVGTLAFALYGLVLFFDLRLSKRLPEALRVGSGEGRTRAPSVRRPGAAAAGPSEARTAPGEDGEP